MLDIILNTIIFFNFSGLDRIQEKVEKSIEIEKTKIIVKKEELWSKNHINTPKIVRSLYYTSNAILYKKKFDNLIKIVKNTSVNSVVIDIKQVDGYVSFKMDDSNFWKIKTVTNNKIKNITGLIKELHSKNIYVIWRIVVFKDNLLSEKRKDLAYKWTKNKEKVWSDYSWNKYLDAWSKEVWIIIVL